MSQTSNNVYPPPPLFYHLYSNENLNSELSEILLNPPQPPLTDKSTSDIESPPFTIEKDKEIETEDKLEYNSNELITCSDLLLKNYINLLTALINGGDFNSDTIFEIMKKMQIILNFLRKKQFYLSLVTLYKIQISDTKQFINTCSELLSDSNAIINNINNK